MVLSSVRTNHPFFINSPLISYTCRLFFSSKSSIYRRTTRGELNTNPSSAYITVCVKNFHSNGVGSATPQTDVPSAFIIFSRISKDDSPSNIKDSILPSAFLFAFIFSCLFVFVQFWAYLPLNSVNCIPCISCYLPVNVQLTLYYIKEIQAFVSWVTIVKWGNLFVYCVTGCPPLPPQGYNYRRTENTF